MNAILEKKLLEHLHQLNCPYCNASMEDVSIDIIDAPTKPICFIIGNPHCDREQQYLLNEARQWLNNYPHEVYREMERLRAMQKKK